jgi:hypothetical protein
MSPSAKEPASAQHPGFARLDPPRTHRERELVAQGSACGYCVALARVHHLLLASELPIADNGIRLYVRATLSGLLPVGVTFSMLQERGVNPEDLYELATIGMPQ